MLQVLCGSGMTRLLDVAWFHSVSVTCIVLYTIKYCLKIKCGLSSDYSSFSNDAKKNKKK